MNSGIISLHRLLTYVSGDDPVGASLHGRSPAGRIYSKLIHKLTAPVSEDRGVYVWGRYKADGAWVNIYVGKTEKRETSSLRARLKEELSNERCVLWRSVLEEEQLFLLGKQFYPSMWVKQYSGEWRRFLLKAGASLIVWIAIPELVNEQIPSVEAGLIALLKPTANVVRPRPTAGLEPLIDEVVSHIYQRTREHRNSLQGG
jgi:hypothetical protein